MEVEKLNTNGEEKSTSLVHLLPKLPESSTKVGEPDSFVELNSGDDYLIDSRVKHAHLGFSWTTTQVDVDASLGAFDKDQKCLDVVWWDKKYSHYLSAELMNDDRTGEKPEGKTVNETIRVNFAEIPNAVHYLLAVLTVYSKGKSLRDVTDISMSLSHGHSDKELFAFKTGDFETAAVVMGMFSRRESWWEFTPLGKPSIGRTVKEVIFKLHLGNVAQKQATVGKSYKIFTWVEEGRDLAASDRPVCGKSTSDCFVEIKYKDVRYVVSEVIVKELDPKWNMKKAEINPTTQSDWGLIEFNVWDHDTTSPDDFLGCVSVAAGGVCQRGVGEHELLAPLGPSQNSEIRPKSGVKIKGEIVIKFLVEEITS